MSPRTLQHMHPFSITTTCSAALCALESSSWSIGTSPNCGAWVWKHH
jgi:hypothetical protein